MLIPMTTFGVLVSIVALLLIVTGFFTWQKGNASNRGVAPEPKSDLTVEMWKSIANHFRLGVSGSTRAIRQRNMGVALMQSGLLLLVLGIITVLPALVKGAIAGGGTGGSTPSPSATPTGS